MMASPRSGGYDVTENKPEDDPEPAEDRVHLDLRGVLNDVDLRAREEGGDYVATLPFPEGDKKRKVQDLGKAITDEDDYSPDQEPDEHEVYTDQNDEDDHPDQTDDDLDHTIELILLLLRKGEPEQEEDMQKAWSEAARKAANEARALTSRRRRLSAKFTGAKHYEMNKQGFLVVQKIKDDTLRQRARDYNNARANYLKTRNHLIDILVGEREGSLDEAAKDFKDAKDRATLAGTYFRITKR